MNKHPKTRKSWRGRPSYREKMFNRNVLKSMNNLFNSSCHGNYPIKCLKKKNPFQKQSTTVCLLQSAPLISSNQVYFGGCISFCKCEELFFSSKSASYTVVKACERKPTALFFLHANHGKMGKKNCCRLNLHFFFGMPETVCSSFHRHYLELLSGDTILGGGELLRIVKSLYLYFFSDFEPKLTACSSRGQYRAWGLCYKDGELMWVTGDLNNSDSIIFQDVLHLCSTEYFCSNLGSSPLWLVEGVCRKKHYDLQYLTLIFLGNSTRRAYLLSSHELALLLANWGLILSCTKYNFTSKFEFCILHVYLYSPENLHSSWGISGIPHSWHK